jgi:hypothetical protein
VSREGNLTSGGPRLPSGLAATSQGVERTNESSCHVAADQFLVDRGLLTGESTLPVSPGGKTLTPAADMTGK